MRTSQETFDFVVDHLIKQKERAVNKNHICQYRDNGRSCAIGCLISDKLAETLTSMGNGGPILISGPWDIAYPALELSDMEKSKAHSFYVMLQATHDKESNPESLRNSLTHMARKFSLSSAKVDQIVEWK